MSIANLRAPSSVSALRSGGDAQFALSISGSTGNAVRSKAAAPANDDAVWSDSAAARQRHYAWHAVTVADDQVFHRLTVARHLQLPTMH